MPQETLRDTDSRIVHDLGFAGRHTVRYLTEDGEEKLGTLVKLIGYRHLGGYKRIVGVLESGECVNYSDIAGEWIITRAAIMKAALDQYFVTMKILEEIPHVDL